MPAVPVVPAAPGESAPSRGPRRARLPGVDAMRGLAAFGVVVIHASLVVGGAVTPAAAAFSAFLSEWVVPFFLAAAFLFAAMGENRRETLGQWLVRRAGRLLVPYVLWAAIYAGARTVKLLLRHETGRAWGPWHDPANLLLTGGGAVALYFLPLLFVGLLVSRALGSLPRRLPVGWLLVLTALATVGVEMLTRSGNSFDLIKGQAFTTALGGNPLADSGPGRIVLALTADAVRCLPYVLLAAALARVLPAAAARWPAAVLRAAGAAVFAVTTLLPIALGGGGRLAWPEILPGFGALLFAWALSLGPWPEGAVRGAGRLGAWSFGIFLMHQLALEVLQLVLGGRLPTPAGPGEILAISLAAFAACAAAIWAAEATGWGWPRRLFAVG